MPPRLARLHVVRAPAVVPADVELSLERAFRLYAPYVAAIALRLLGRDGEIDDVVQDVFLAGHKGIAALREPEAIKGWLATVTVRVARRRLWTRKFRSFLRLDDAPDYERVASAEASPEERALLKGVYALLDDLPVEQRLAWSLRHLEGEELGEIARVLGCSLATAKRRVGAAHAVIERALEHG
jgi:RNA polymerase sigma-70 factor (ECF subfamily)